MLDKVINAILLINFCCSVAVLLFFLIFAVILFLEFR